MTEVPLNAGRTTKGIVRVGDTVRRPLRQNSEFVHNLLQRLSEQNFPYAPQFLGIDAQGRETLTFVDGEVPSDLGEFSLPQIERAGQILASFHNLTANFTELKGFEEVICHGDPSPCNYVLREDVPVSLIDFDAAFAGPKWLDIGYGAWLWSNLGSPQQSPAQVASKLRAYMLGYGEDLVECLEAITQAQDWQLDRLRSSRPEWMKAAMQWTLSCQRWFRQNEAELRRCLICVM